MSFSWVLGLSALGLVISLYLLYVKLRNKKLICFLGEDCDAVVKSKYGYLFKIPNEALGVLYYTGMIVGTVLAVNILFLQAAAVLALVASLALVVIQAFFLKKWCEWCMATALINLALFLLVI
ncbi:MAG: vitamin K epoxide reductase family protein [bacterium]|nr:vitamin K epoxide reductase family protein [Candidatus Wildermuthbacteria bacterium]MDP2664811.1 vitamin K epoxide reductase family protein [bacterium]